MTRKNSSVLVIIGICTAGLVVMFIAGFLILRAMMTLNVKEYIVFRFIGMKKGVLRRINYIELAIYCVIAMVVALVLAFILRLAGVGFITDITWYYRFGTYICFVLYNILLCAVTLGSYEYASINAYNFWNMLGLNWSSQYDKLLGIQYKTWGTIAIILTVIAALIISYRCKKNSGKYYYIGGFVVTVVFAFAVRMHERYLFPAMVMFIAAFAVRLRKEIYILYSLICAVVFYNAAYVLFIYDVNNFDPKAPIPIANLDRSASYSCVYGLCDCKDIFCTC